jgi:hypothetical protein
VPALRPRTLGLWGGLALLLLAALAARGASAALISPLPTAGFVPVFLVCLVTVLAVSIVVNKMALPRIVRRLLAIGAMAVSVWSIGTIARALYTLIAFAVADGVEQGSMSWMVTGFPNGSGEQTLGAMSPETQRGVSVVFDGAAVEAISRGARCFDLEVERTPSGLERIRLPDDALGANDLVACPAVQRLGR